MDNNVMTPKQIVAELDRYIIGQHDAKVAVAIALRNRYRRSKLPEEMREEITPKNIIMKGPTGVGKTEIARRLAKVVKAPFVKVEATKFTEVGYVGRDVESIIRDLVEVSIRLVKDEKFKDIACNLDPEAKKYCSLSAKTRQEQPKRATRNFAKNSCRKSVQDTLTASRLRWKSVNNPSPFSCNRATLPATRSISVLSLAA